MATIICPIRASATSGSCKQSSFPMFFSDAAQIALLQSKFHRLMKYQMIKTLKPFEISTVEWIILGYLDTLDTPVPLSSVAEEVGIQDSFMAVLTVKLAEKKMITLESDASDKRKKLVSISRKGSKTIELSQRNFVKFFFPLLKGLDKADLGRFFSIIKKIIKNFESM